MKWMLDVPVLPSPQKISYEDKILFMGSCFSQEIGSKLKALKFNVLQNPNGILYDPVSLSEALVSYMVNKKYIQTGLVKINELWHSWQHHSSFSDEDHQEVLSHINSSQDAAHGFISSVDWLVISLGTAFHYLLAKENIPVVNCHKAPSSFFTKELLTISEIEESLEKAIAMITAALPKVHIILTVSPVRHIRDGIVENNHSKARLLEAVHKLTSKFPNVEYFPAYEIMMDELRDYRFYKKDLVHPNEMATQYIFEKFTESYIAGKDVVCMESITEILNAVQHTPLHEASEGYAVFKKNQLEKIARLQQQFHAIDLSAEMRHFSG
ncbi:MAG: GSCFA domain-containing protein [Ginsengibacter sp.]